MGNNMRSLLDFKTVALPLLIAILLVVTSQYNFLLFHTLSEFFVIVVAILAAVVAWLMYAYTKNNFLMYLGCGYFWVGALDLLHALSYKGISIFPGEGANLSTQFWIGTRYIEAVLLLTAPILLSKDLNRGAVFTLYGVAACGLVISIAYKVFPVSFVEGSGLTEFKVFSEYIIIVMLALAIYFLERRRNLIALRVFTLIVASVVFTMLAELAFTFYVSVYGLSNIVGHIFKFFSFWLFFIAVVRTPLQEPFSVLSKAETYYDAVPDAAIIIDKHGVIQHVNQAACALVNKTTIELIGSNVHKEFHEKNSSQLSCPVCHSLANDAELSGVEIQVSKALWFDFSLSPISGMESFIEVIRDVTHKKNTSLALEKSEKNLSSTLNSIYDAVIATDAGGNVIRMNPVAERLTGWSLKRAKRVALSKIFSISSVGVHQEMAGQIDRALSLGETIRFNDNVILTSKTGEEYCIAVSASPIRDTSGEILGMVLVFSDVTEQYHLRESAAKNRLNLQAIMDNSPAVIYVKDLNGCYQFINRCYEELFHVRREDVVNMTDYDLFPRANADEYRASDQAVAVAGHAIKSEEMVPLGDGIHSYISIKFPLLDEAGEIYAVCGISTDITERKNIEVALKESESNLNRAQKIAKIGNWKLTPDTGVVECSQELFNILRLNGEVMLDDLYRAVHPDDRDNVLKPVYAAVPWDFEHRLLFDDGEIKWVHAVGEPVLGDGGKTINIIGVMQDITARKLADEMVWRTQKMDALGKLTGGVAHDFNNMLGVMLGYTELLEDKLNDKPDLMRYLKEIRHAGTRGAKLTQRLLSFSRYKASDLSVVDINHLLNELHHMLERALTARIKLVLTFSDELWPVMLDHGDFEDAILNISINAMHSMEGCGQLHIQTGNLEVGEADEKVLQVPCGDYVTCSISDTGCGMDDAIKEQLFDPFFTTKGERGTGLGLSQVYGFMERHNGFIKVDSSPGSGSVFTLYFPRYSGEIVYRCVSDETDEIVGLCGKERVLVVDDEHAMTAMIKEVLGNHGYQVVAVDSAKQALNVLEQQAVDIMLADVVMPDVDGCQLVTLVKERFPGVRIQLISGYSDQSRVNFIDDELHKNMLFKPYDSAELLRRIRGLLDGKDNLYIEQNAIRETDEETSMQ